MTIFLPDQFRDKNGNVEILQVDDALAVGTNQEIIALTAGQKVRIISGWINSNTATAAQVFFLSNSVKITANRDIAGNSHWDLLPHELGHIESTLAQNLALTVAGAGIEYFFRYIKWTPF